MSICGLLGPGIVVVDALWNIIKPWLVKITNTSSTQNTITIRCVSGPIIRYSGDLNSTPNTANHYYAVVWYISDVLKYTASYHCDVDEYVAGRTNIPLSLGNVDGIPISYNGNTLSISHTSTPSTSNNGPTVNNDLTISGPSNDVIIGFLNDILSKYKDVLEKSTNNHLMVYINTTYSGPIWHGYRMRIHKTFDNTFYDGAIKDTIIRDVQEFISNESRYVSLGIPYKRGYLLYGPMGTGKSSAWYALSRLLHRNVYKLSLESLDVTSIKHAVSSIPSNSIMVIDDIDTIPFSNTETASPNNDDDDESLVTPPTSHTLHTSPMQRYGISVSVLLEILDGYDYLHGCIVVFTSNYPEKLDQRLLRSGRIDLRLNIGYPSVDVIKSMMVKVYGKTPDIPSSTPINITTADIMSKVITANPTYEDAVVALTSLLVN